MAIRERVLAEGTEKKTNGCPQNNENKRLVKILTSFIGRNLRSTTLVGLGGIRLLRAETSDDIQESLVVQLALLGTASELLALGGLLNLGGLTLDFAGTRQTTVNLACERFAQLAN